ncbi:hypothetical protein [Cytobacillus gottheilii]|uniref:hypothetical protein n=1 Tax=Cytobacillus gottheilii TaxID=859144 RepID=UPI0008363BC6|nr:hypothetical protein [Cytobacillus gottheilii]
MLNNLFKLPQGLQAMDESNSMKPTKLKVVEATNLSTLTIEERAKREERLNELIESKLGKKVLEEWQIEVLYGRSSSLNRQSHAIKLTNNITGESIAFLKNEIQNMKNADQIVDTLNIIGEVERNYIRFFGNYINAARVLPDRVTVVKDLSLVVSERNLAVGFTVLEYYQFFAQDYFHNQGLYPTKSSNQFKKGVSHGIIHDSESQGYFKNEYGYYPVAIRSGNLEKLFPYMSDQEFGQVISKLNHLGVLHESTSRRIERNTKPKRRIKMVDMQLEKKGDPDYHEDVYIFNIIPHLLEGSN